MAAHHMQMIRVLQCPRPPPACAQCPNAWSALNIEFVISVALITSITQCLIVKSCFHNTALTVPLKLNVLARRWQNYCFLDIGCYAPIQLTQQNDVNTISGMCIYY